MKIPMAWTPVSTRQRGPPKNHSLAIWVTGVRGICWRRIEGGEGRGLTEMRARMTPDTARLTMKMFWTVWRLRLRTVA